MVTSTERPLCRLVTTTLVPSGSFRCAAVSFSGSNSVPLAVGRFANCAPYQEACPMTSFGAGAGVDAEAGHAASSVASADADGIDAQTESARNETRTTRTE